MKKKQLILLILLLLISAFLFDKLILNKDGKTDNTSASSEDNTDDTNDGTKKEADFTEGVSIKKYPDDYACFKFETPDGYKIVCDPYNLNEVVQPNIVVESHQDLDHSDTTAILPPFELIKDPGEYDIDDIKITGFAGKHGKNMPEGSNNIFVININNIKIAHFASQGDIPSNEILNGIGTVDVLIVQVFDEPSYNKLLPEDADVIINSLKPKIIIPEHAGEGAGDLLAQHLNIPVEKEESGSIIVTRKMLDEAADIRIIDLFNYNQ